MVRGEHEMKKCLGCSAKATRLWYNHKGEPSNICGICFVMVSRLFEYKIIDSYGLVACRVIKKVIR